MLVVNTTVVRALMTLRGLNRKSLAKLAGVREDNLRAWLSGADSADLCMARKNQILVLRSLGVDEEAPRADTVHAWVLDETTNKRREEGIAALHTIVSAYQDAQVVHFGLNADSAFTFSEHSHFGLFFTGFRAVLTVKPGFFRDVQFSPDSVKGFTWAAENPVCLLPDFRFLQITSSDVTPTEFDDFATGQVELSKWENLHLLAREHQIRAEDIAKWMFSEVAEREERLSISLEQARKHVLLEDGKLVVNATVTSDVTTDTGDSESIAEVLPRKAEVNNIMEHRLFVQRS
jgi:transcriptional regulator with XRE-family HTH domain